jgi:CRISPR-associated protein Cas2
MVVNMYVVLLYDIEADETGAKVSRNIFKICKKYLTHVQKSVFEGDITPALLQQLKIELERYIRKDKDSVIIFKSRQERWMKKEFWGMIDEKTSNLF